MSKNIYDYLKENFNIETDYKFKRDYIKEPLKRGKNQFDTEHFDKDDLYYLYITLNIRLNDIVKMFNMKLKSVRREILYHKIKKNQKDAIKNSRQYYQKHYGVNTASQVPEIREKQLKASFEKYGCICSLWGKNSYKLSERSNNKSKGENGWLLSLNIPVDKKHRQVKIQNYIVDGFDPDTNTIYEYLGDYWHGNPKIFNPLDKNNSSHKTYGELYRKTMNRLNHLKNIGYNVCYIWESEYKKGLPLTIL